MKGAFQNNGDIRNFCKEMVVVKDKAKCFQLFNEGKKPTDEEIKPHASKPTAYKYYREWLITQIITSSVQGQHQVILTTFLFMISKAY